MKAKEKPSNLPDRNAGKKNKNDLRGYPLYPATEDIYSQCHEEMEINPEDVTKIKEPDENTKVGKRNEKDFEEDVSGADLDIPGAELDDGQEIVGSEDEENNYYSLGGEDHLDLEENKGN